MLRPCFTTDLDTVTATEGRPSTLRCVVTGRPTPNVTWYKEDKVIKNTPSQEIQYINNIATLSLKKTNLFDAGRYQCKAVNPAGEATTSAELIVEGNCMNHLECCSFSPGPGIRVQACMLHASVLFHAF